MGVSVVRVPTRRARAVVVACFAVLGAACGDDAPPIDPPPDGGGWPDGGSPDGGAPAFRAECENINPMHCLLPWPSSRYLVDDVTTETGLRIEIPVEAMPTRSGGTPIDPAQLERFDGFSPATSMITSFAGRVDGTPLADEAHIDDSLGADSPTVLLDYETGERVAHFAELDSWPVSEANELRRPLYIRPAARLAENRRYVVAIRGLALEDGTPIEPSDYFRALRDGTPLAGADDLESRRARFEEIFAALEEAGVARGTLIEAWDFETASGPSIHGDLLAMRDAALQAVEDDDEPRCTVTSMTDAPAAEIFRRVEGTVRVPHFLAGTSVGVVEDNLIVRDSSGAPVQNGWVDVPFTLDIPVTLAESVAAGGSAGRLVDYGHGLLGSRSEATSGWMRDTLETTGMAVVAIDWWGMAMQDLGRLASALQEFSKFPSITERLAQGLVNHVVLHRSFRTECTELAELAIELDGGGTAPAIDPEELYYYGNSQGGIMGLALAGIAVDVERFVIGVGGMSYSVMIPRSSNWQTYGAIMQIGYSDPLVRALIMVMAQSQWDIAEPSTYVPHVLSDPLPCDADVCASGLTPLKHVLFQIGRDDAQVANVTADIAARTMGLAYVDPAAYTPWGLDSVTAAMGETLGDDALVVFDIPGTPVLPLGTRDPGGDNPAHEGVRRSAAAIEQIDLFLRAGGSVVQTCDGVCDPT